MKRVIVFFFLMIFCIEAKDYRALYPLAWKSFSLNQSATALYGEEKFSTLQKSDEIELIVPTITISDTENIPIRIYSTLKAKTVALFKDKSPYHLIAMLDLKEQEGIEVSMNIRLDIKNTLFAVVEGVDGKLYYTRAFVDVLCLSCTRASKSD